MNEAEEASMNFRRPLAENIRAAALRPQATPHDRLAAAVLLLAIEVHDHGVLMTTPVMVKNKDPANAP